MNLPVFLGEFIKLPRPEKIVRILGSKAKHISVRRLKAGTEILLANDADKMMRVQLIYVDSHKVHIRVITAEEHPRPRPHVAVIQALPKSDHTELAVDLITEAGADKIIPWAAVNCVARWQGTAKVAKTRARWQLTAHETAKQVRRAWIPSVADLHSSANIEQLIRETTSAGGATAVLHEEKTTPFMKLVAQATNAGRVLSIVDPEGGVNPEELEAFRAADTSPVVLGPTVLRNALAGATALCTLDPLAKRQDGAPTRSQQNRRIIIKCSVATRTTATIGPDDNLAPIVVGHAGQNLRLLESLPTAGIHVRGGVMTVRGIPADVSLATRAFKELEAMARRGHELSSESVRHAVGIVSRGKKSTSEILSNGIVTHRGKTVRPKAEGQKNYVDAIDRYNVVFGIGPAGTGGTFLTVARAVAALKNKQVERIILAHPAVEASENLDFLPGTLHEKIGPCLHPLHDTMHEMLEPELIPKLMRAGIVEVASLTYMRNRTLNNAFIILNEAQNTAPAQMKMFLTRLGFGSRMVITGDASQVSLPRGQKFGLAVAREVLRGMSGIAFPALAAAGVVRNPLVTAIIKAYDDHDAYSEGIGQGTESLQKRQPATKR